MRLEVYELDPAKVFSASRLALQAALKKDKVKLKLLTGIVMLLMVEKGIRGGLCHSINSCAKANNKYMKDYDKNTEFLCLEYWDINNFHSWAMPQKLSVNRFNWIEIFPNLIFH